MANIGHFDATTVNPSTAFETIPAGKYLAQIVNSEMRETKRGDGQYLSLELEIIDGHAAGRKLFERLNLINPNAQAVEISQRTLSAICHAIGKMSVSDSEQLHFAPMMVTVKVKPAGNDKSGTYREASNEIGGYAAANGAAPARAAGPAASHAAPAAAAKPAAATPPWKRTA